MEQQRKRGNLGPCSSQNEKSFGSEVVSHVEKQTRLFPFSTGKEGGWGWVSAELCQAGEDQDMNFWELPQYFLCT